jgi:hypothetical protein
MRQEEVEFDVNTTSDLTVASTAEVRDVLISALHTAQQMGERFIGLEHIVVAALDQEGSLVDQAMKQMNTDAVALKSALLSTIEQSRKRAAEDVMREGTESKGRERNVRALGAASPGTAGVCVRLVPVRPPDGTANLVELAGEKR